MIDMRRTSSGTWVRSCTFAEMRVIRRESYAVHHRRRNRWLVLYMAAAVVHTAWVVLAVTLAGDGMFADAALALALSHAPRHMLPREPKWVIPRW